MKNIPTLVLLTFLLSAALTVAQTASPINAAAKSQALPLQRYDPQMRSAEKKIGEEVFSIAIDSAISPASEKALIGYFTQHYVSRLMALEIAKMPGADHLYIVTGLLDKAGQAEDITKPPTILLVLKEQGDTISEVGKAESDDGGGYGVLAPVFFHGKDKLLIIVALSSADGDARLDLVYEYADNTFKPLGQLDVIEKVGMNGNIWQIESPVVRATAAHKNDTYFVTVRGVRGSLYGGSTDAKGNPKKLAPPKSPVTFYYDKGTWRRAATR
ncbi:MAG: hypothetical protein QOJ64_2058 [Acidobacteriota bacterium]|jgi:hypothetical protein|nr:hypothetical protein [Acidobacteriota bacterium]